MNSGRLEARTELESLNKKFMNSKNEVKQLLKESGNEKLFTEENYRIATALTKEAEKRDKMLKQFFMNAEGFREKYKHDLIVKNCS